MTRYTLNTGTMTDESRVMRGQAADAFLNQPEEEEDVPVVRTVR